MFDHSKRPYFNDSIIELETCTNANWSDCAMLIHLALELFHRKTPRAIELRLKLLNRIADLIAQGFPWPSTEAEAGSSGTDLFIDAPSKGLLGYLGYRVGASGIEVDERLALLDTAFTDRLPPVNSAEYMAQWGVPASAMRLRKMAHSIAAFVRNAKRSSNPPIAAIEDWESDLHYLYTNHYIGRFDFLWPSTE